jgi:hypothetical protein
LAEEGQKAGGFRAALTHFVAKYPPVRSRKRRFVGRLRAALPPSAHRFGFWKPLIRKITVARNG